MSAKETASGEEHGMNEKEENRAMAREDDRMTHKGKGMRGYFPHACPTVCTLSSSCSVIAVSVATEAAEPHGGQPCKEHKRPI